MALAAHELNRWEEVIKKAQAQVEEFEQSGKKDSSFYVVPALAQLLEKAMEIGQYDTKTSEVRKVRRVLKINRYIPRFMIDYHGAESVFLEGLYMVVEGYLIPTERYKEYVKGWKTGAKPEDFGLPSESEVLYTTIKEIDTGTCFALCRSWLTEIVRAPHHWSYLHL